MNKLKVLLHIPHTSLRLPKIFYKGLLISKEELRKYNLKISDLEVDYLFKDIKGKRIKAKYSRLFCDVEKFKDETQEFMSKYGYLSALKSLNYEDAELSQVAEGTLNYVNSGNVNVLSKSVNMHALLNNTFKQVVNDIASGEMTAEQACQALSDDAKR